MQEQDNRRPLGLVVSGETRRHSDTLRKLLGPGLVDMLNADDIGDVLGLIKHGQADAVVIDSERDDQELLITLRMIRRVTWTVPVVLVTRQVSRPFLEGALRLKAFSIVHKPIGREELLIQVQRIVTRITAERQ